MLGSRGARGGWLRGRGRGGEMGFAAGHAWCHFPLLFLGIVSLRPHHIPPASHFWTLKLSSRKPNFLISGEIEGGQFLIWCGWTLIGPDIFQVLIYFVQLVRNVRKYENRRNFLVFFLKKNCWVKTPRSLFCHIQLSVAIPGGGLEQKIVTGKILDEILSRIFLAILRIRQDFFPGKLKKNPFL